MVGKVLYCIGFVICGIVWFQWHAIVTHALWSVLAKLSIPLTGNLSVLFAPKSIHRILGYILPWTVRGGSSSYALLLT